MRNASDKALQFTLVRAKIKLEKDWSIGVYEKSSGKLVAIALSEITTNNYLRGSTYFKRQDFTPSLEDEESRMFFKDLLCDVHDLLSEKLFMIGMVTVHSDYRRRGITSLIWDFCCELAKGSGCNYAITVPITEYMCESLRKKGWTLLKEVNYKEYDRKNNTKVFCDTKHPWIKAQAVYKKIACLATENHH